MGTPTAWAAITSLVLAAVAALWWAVIPYSVRGVSTFQEGSVRVVQQTHSSFVAENGAWTVIPLLIPVILALLGLLGAIKGNRALLWTTAIISLVLCFLSASSIGMPYLPAAIALLVAAFTARGEVAAP